MKKNGKFKVIAVVLTAMMLLSAMSMSAFAASITYGDITAAAVEDTDDYEVTVTYTAADCAAGDYVTVLVVVGNEGALNDDTNPTNVIYIDQQAVADGAGSFTFKVAKSTIDNQDVYVKLGATNQATAAAGQKTFTVTTPGGDVLEVEINSNIGDSFGTTGLNSVIITPKTEIPAGKAVLYDGTPMMYTKYNVEGVEVVKYIGLFASFDAAKLTVGDGAMTQVLYGNLDASDDNTVIDAKDLNEIINIVLDNSVASTDHIKIIGDVNGDGKLDAKDLNEIINIVLDGNVLPSVVTQ